MFITKATYGGQDCTEVIQSKIKNDKLIIRSSNDLIGDVMPGVVKYLELTGEHNGQPFTESIKEGTLITLPKSNVDRLGIFYSNNNNQRILPAIKKSLDTIRIAAEGKADIVTCVWYPIQNNPFHQIISWYQSQSHLNQLLQIMQCLYSAREIAEYKYVSFLEHDVMYPEGYFDYPDIEPGHVLANMNYMGICRDGFQEVPTKHEPFHQMTMRFDEAIMHCESILVNALITNSGLIEPQIPDVIRTQWDCVNPAVHINHGHHFTSHYSIYSSTDLSKTNPYWGEHDQYLNLFS